MLIRKYLWPDRYFDDISSVTPKLLEELGVRALICDIDNTLVTYDDPLPTESCLEWFESMKTGGIKLSFVSNNRIPRAEIFAEGTGCYAVSESGKPGVKRLREAMAFMDVKPDETAVLGDQIFTDILAGHLAGTKTILIKPIRDKLTPLFRLKRALEKPILRSFSKHIKRKEQKPL